MTEEEPLEIVQDRQAAMDAAVAAMVASNPRIQAQEAPADDQTPATPTLEDHDAA